MDCLIADPFDRMCRLVSTLSNRVDDHMAALFACEVSSLCCIFEAVNSGLVGELHRFNGAIDSFHGNRLRTGIYFSIVPVMTFVGPWEP